MKADTANIYEVHSDWQNNLSLVPCRKAAPFAIKSGVESYFVLLCKEIGIKFFDSQEEAKFSHKRQEAACSIDAAPVVLSEIDQFGIRKGQQIIIRWGYKTGVAKIFGSDRRFNPYRKKAQEVAQRLSDIEAGGGDIHPWNYGLYNGRVVCVDFGQESG